MTCVLKYVYIYIYIYTYTHTHTLARTWPKIIYLNRPPAGCRRPQIFDFSGFSGFSDRFPGFSWSGRARAAPGTHFRAPGSIFHAGSRIFMLKLNFSSIELDFSPLSAYFRGRGGSGRVQGPMFLLWNRFFMLRIDLYCPGISFST